MIKAVFALILLSTIGCISSRSGPIHPNVPMGTLPHTQIKEEISVKNDWATNKPVVNVTFAMQQSW